MMYHYDRPDLHQIWFGKQTLIVCSCRSDGEKQSS